MTNGTAQKSQVLPLFKRAMLISLRISKWSARKHDKEVSQEVAVTHGLTDAALGAYRKQLIPKEALQEINQLDSQAREVLYKFTLPGRVDGERILTGVHYTECMNKLRELKSSREVAVMTFLSKFVAWKEEQKLKLNGLYREEDYPSLEELDDKFDLVIDIEPMPDSASFEVAGIVDAEVERIESERNERHRAMVASAMKAPFQRLQEVVNNMVVGLKKFEKTEEGVKHPFRNTLVSNIQDLLDLIPGLNLTDDAELNAFAQEVRGKLACLSAEELRDDEKVREATIATAEEIAAAINEKMSEFI